MTNQASSTTARKGVLDVEPFQYAVIDLAVAETLQEDILGLLPSAAEPLLARKYPQELLRVGPWLVRLSKAADVQHALTEMAADVPWGYYVYSTFDIVSLRHSLRRFNLVRVPGIEREVLFRYWDPRVMQVFLDTATPQQRAKLFELIDQIKAGDGSFDEIDSAISIED